MRAELRDKIIAVCNKKIAAKGDNVGVSFYAFLLGSVALCGSIFVLFERAYIAALDMWLSNLSKYRVTKRKVRSKEPFGSA
jgi:1,4-dihydroxy-2-naphthoate octaprenyltransferase